MRAEGDKSTWRGVIGDFPPVGKGLHLGLELELRLTPPVHWPDSHRKIVDAMEEHSCISKFGLTKVESPGIEYATRPASLAVHAHMWAKILPILQKLPVTTGTGVGGHIHIRQHEDKTIQNRVGWLMNRLDTRQLLTALTRPPNTGGYSSRRYLTTGASNYHIITNRGGGDPVVLGDFNTYEFRAFPASLEFPKLMAYLEMAHMAWYYAQAVTNKDALNLYDAIEVSTANGSYPYLREHFRKQVLDAKLEKSNAPLIAEARASATAGGASRPA